MKEGTVRAGEVELSSVMLVKTGEAIQFCHGVLVELGNSRTVASKHGIEEPQEEGRAFAPEWQSHRY
jgi:hypothetical protein